MRLHELFLCTTLISFALSTVSFGSPTSIKEDVGASLRDEAATSKTISGRVAFPPAPLIKKDKILGAAYYDALSILSSPNRCSDFFGGPSTVNIFNQLISKARKGYFPTSIGMRLSGTTTTVFNADSKKEYRLFEKVSINANGPFYRKRHGNWEASIPRVGTFQPNTKEVRVLILLHELGHAVKGPHGEWLLPDDGNDPELSRMNTQRIERVCGDQIKARQREPGETKGRNDEINTHTTHPELRFSQSVKSSGTITLTVTGADGNTATVTRVRFYRLITADPLGPIRPDEKLV